MRRGSQISPPLTPGQPGDPQDLRETLRVIVRALARAAAVEEHRRRGELERVAEGADD